MAKSFSPYLPPLKEYLTTPFGQTSTQVLGAFSATFWRETGVLRAKILNVCLPFRIAMLLYMKFPPIVKKKQGESKVNSSSSLLPHTLSPSLVVRPSGFPADSPPGQPETRKAY